MNNLPFRKVLVLSPHTDDAELAAGGTISRLVAEGAEVHVVAFSHCGDPVLLSEFKKATKTLKARATCLEFEKRRFHAQRQEILDAIIGVVAADEPDLVLAPSSFDSHQDHQVVSAEAVRGTRGVTLWGYQSGWNNRQFSADVFVRLASEDLAHKMKAVQCYVSQADRAYCADDALYSQARTNGVACGHKLAEAFEVMRLVL